MKLSHLYLLFALGTATSANASSLRISDKNGNNADTGEADAATDEAIDPQAPMVGDHIQTDQNERKLSKKLPSEACSWHSDCNNGSIWETAFYCYKSNVFKPGVCYSGECAFQ